MLLLSLLLGWLGWRRRASGFRDGGPAFAIVHGLTARRRVGKPLPINAAAGGNRLAAGGSDAATLDACVEPGADKE